MTRIVFCGFYHLDSTCALEVPSSVFYQEELFEQKFQNLKCLQDNVQPVDASIEDTGNEFAIVPETEGNLVDQEKLRETVIKALTTGDPVADLEEDGCYINPQVTEMIKGS